MSDRSRLGNMILQHWQKYLPAMVNELELSGRLESAIAQAESRAADMLYQLLSVQKMPYQEAWETAMQECLLPEEEPSPLTLSRNRPGHATSA